MPNSTALQALLKRNAGRSPVRITSAAEELSHAGLLYRYSLDYTYTQNQERYFTFQAPATHIVEIVYRTMASDATGVEFARMQDTLGANSSQLNGLSSLDGSNSPAPIWLMGTPTVPGTVSRVPLYSGATSGGSSNRAVGTYIADLGSDMILPGVSTVVRIKNLAQQSNRIIVGIGLAFIPV